MVELTDKELNGLTDDELFDYLDERANYLKKSFIFNWTPFYELPRH